MKILLMKKMEQCQMCWMEDDQYFRFKRNSKNYHFRDLNYNIDLWDNKTLVFWDYTKKCIYFKHVYIYLTMKYTFFYNEIHYYNELSYWWLFIMIIMKVRHRLQIKVLKYFVSFDETQSSFENKTYPNHGFITNIYWYIYIQISWKCLT